MTSMQTAQTYFDLSNESDFDGIGSLFTESTTYVSQTTGKYVGRKAIMDMQRAFHGKFSSLHWHVNSVTEVKPNVILFDYTFTGELLSKETIKSAGLEFITVKDGKILHVEIKSK